MCRWPYTTPGNVLANIFSRDDAAVRDLSVGAAFEPFTAPSRDRLVPSEKVFYGDPNGNRECHACH